MTAHISFSNGEKEYLRRHCRTYDIKNPSNSKSILNIFAANFETIKNNEL